MYNCIYMFIDLHIYMYILVYVSIGSQLPHHGMYSYTHNSINKQTQTHVHMRRYMRARRQPVTGHTHIRVYICLQTHTNRYVYPRNYMHINEYTRINLRT